MTSKSPTGHTLCDSQCAECSDRCAYLDAHDWPHRCMLHHLENADAMEAARTAQERTVLIRFEVASPFEGIVLAAEERIINVAQRRTPDGGDGRLVVYIERVIS